MVKSTVSIESSCKAKSGVYYSIMCVWVQVGYLYWKSIAELW